MKNLIWAFIALALFAAPCLATANPVPLPPSEYALPTAVAEEFLAVSPENHTLEGAIFDKNGNLYFCDVTDKSVYKVDPEKRMSLVAQLADLAPGGLGFGPDGRLYIAALDLERAKGAILALDFASGDLAPVLPVEAGFMPNDLVFTSDGGIYFSDFKGTATVPTGGVYYLAPDFASAIPVIPNLAQANGVALSPDEKTLWATEYAANRLHRASLASRAAPTPTGTKIPYYFIGPGPDSMRVDAEGNVYVAIMGQGRVMIFNQNGMPIGQILLPGRDKGQNLRSASFGLHPDRKELRVVAGNAEDAPIPGANIFSGPALAPAINK